MINFHKYGFLDVNKLRRYLDDKHIWLSRFNPVWMFIWKDYYKFEISYDNEFAYIRFLMPDIGLCYYPPLALANAKIEDGVKRIMADAKELGIDFNMAPLNKDLSLKLEITNLRFKENEKFKSYIYQTEDLCYYSKNKQAKKALKKFDKMHKDAYYRAIKKEDFPQILEFIENWHLNQKEIDDILYYAKLKSIKELFDHLYEFDLMAIELLDENGIYGIVISSIYDNLAYVHLFIGVDEIGVNEKLMSILAHETLRFARYINLEEDMDSKVLEERYNYFKPFLLEKFYSTFRL